MTNYSYGTMIEGYENPIPHLILFVVELRLEEKIE